MKQIDSFVEMCIQKKYVTQDNAPWLRYALEKRIGSLVAFTPLLILGLLITNPSTVISFLFSFSLLRTRTNGFHAKTIGKCIVYSILEEIFFLKVLPMTWNNMIASVALAISIMLIWTLAPYNHPNMDLSLKEVTACAKSAKWRLGILVCFLTMLYESGQNQLALGILLGIVMTASTLVVAYCSQITMPEENDRETEQN